MAGNVRPPIDDGAVLITGASAGIGRELAVQLAPRARMLILLARRAGRLEELRASLLARHPRLQASVQVVGRLARQWPQLTLCCFTTSHVRHGRIRPA